ncbi:MAG: hypothetical protein IJY84_05300 [Clostridia bacterium]|nr:hypothetical protein [Clostridia bacterium]
MQETTVSHLKDLIEQNGLIKALRSVYGSAVKVKIFFSDAVCKLKIEELDLPVRGYNCLKRVGINFIEDLICRIETADLTAIRNMGKKTVSEIKTRLLEFVYDGLSSGQKTAFLQAVIADNQPL